MSLDRPSPTPGVGDAQEALPVGARGIEIEVCGVCGIPLPQFLWAGAKIVSGPLCAHKEGRVLYLTTVPPGGLQDTPAGDFRKVLDALQPPPLTVRMVDEGRSSYADGWRRGIEDAKDALAAAVPVQNKEGRDA